METIRCGKCGRKLAEADYSSLSGAAALAQGKRFTGIEVSEHYFRVAVERLRGG